jgi:ribosome biogenesis GTPase / thiamine phosphate phosphatase
MRGRVVKSTGSWYEIREEEDGYRVKARLRGKFRMAGLKVTNPVAVGDWVRFEKEQSVTGQYEILEIESRENYFIRKSTHKTAHDHLIATNLDQIVILFTLQMPRTSIGFLDRALVTAEAYRIPVVIVFNKIDIYSDEQKKEVEYYADAYRNIGYDCLLASALENIGLEPVKEKLAGKTTLVMGHSGAGKSTLMNTLFPGLNLTTSEISPFAQKGVHTTTFAEMFELSDDTFLIDTPGIKELGISEIGEEELSHYFPEMREMIGQCRFHNCRHLNEPGCAVQQALEEGKISNFRFNSYLSIITGEDNRK